MDKKANKPKRKFLMVQLTNKLKADMAYLQKVTDDDMSGIVRRAVAAEALRLQMREKIMNQSVTFAPPMELPHE